MTPPSHRRCKHHVAKRDSLRPHPALLQFRNSLYDTEIRRVICSTNAIVIWSASRGVFDVEHALLNRPVLLAGCGYLQRSRRQSQRRQCACYAGGFAGFVA